MHDRIAVPGVPLLRQLARCSSAVHCPIVFPPLSESSSRAPAPRGLIGRRGLQDRTASFIISGTTSLWVQNSYDGKVVESLGFHVHILFH